MVIVNGISFGAKTKIANGASCLAAQLVAGFKTKAGQVYLEPAGTRDMGEEYSYIISCKQGERPTVEVFSGPVTAFGIASAEGATTPEFKGNADELLAWSNKGED